MGLMFLGWICLFTPLQVFGTIAFIILMGIMIAVNSEPDYPRKEK